MTLQEAIDHAREASVRLAQQEGCAECAAEHKQLADWLENYQQLLQQAPVAQLDKAQVYET